MMHGVLRACAARIRIVLSALLVPLLALFCATLTPQAAWAASCNPTITLSAVGATANQSFTACDTSLFGFYGGLWESLGVDASANWPIGARPSGPPNEETIDTAKARYGLSANVTTGVYTFRLIQVFNATAPTDTITLYSFVGPVDSSPAFTNTTNTITVNLPAPTITLSPSSLPGALQNIAYSQTVSASGGTAPYTFAVTSGSLPTGLSLSSSGSITGTPTGTGTSIFTVTATDNNTFTGNKVYSIVVTAAPTITLSPTTVPTPLQNIAYSQTVSASGGTAPYSYAVTAGSLPTGLSLNSSSGAITGTPTTAGAFSFTVTATDANTYTGARAYSGSVTAAPTITVSPSSLPSPLENLAYSQTVSASGGTAPYSYVVTAGSLPAGLSLNSSTGAVTGTPTAAGAFSFTVTATDANTYTGARAYSGSVTAAPTITLSPTTVPNGLQNIAYSQTVSASGGTAPYSYAVTAGSLPTGLSLNSSSGAITGTPTTAGAFSFTVTATDANTYTGARAYSGSVTAAPTITVSPTTVPNGMENIAYSQTVTASGGTAPYSYAVTAGALPAGLSLNASSGAITGTPTASGTFNFTVTATDDNTYTGSRAYALSITAAPTITVSPSSLPSPLENLAYSQTVSASGGTGPYSYAVTAGALPAGLSLNSSSGAVTGTPTAAGAFSFTVTATDANTYTGARAYSGSVTATPTITLSPSTIPDGAQNIAYSQTVSASGGTAPYSYAVTAGALPVGLTLNSSTGAITGMPTAAGAFSFTVTATDANTYTGSRAYTGNINLAPTITLSPSSLPSGMENIAYSQTVTASGGTAPYSYAVTAGALPAGLSLNASSGALTGTPTASGTFNFTVTATDDNTYTGSRAYALSIAAAPTIALSPTTIPDGQVGMAYSQTVTASGGTAPYGYAVTAGALPAGLSLNSSTGAITGTPTTAGAFSFTITATDANTYTGSRAYTGNITAVPTIALAPTTLSNGQVGTAYSQTVTATGGTAPYGYAVTVGSLPAGLSLNSSTGALTGTPTTAGAFSFTVTATDANTYTGSRAYTGTINPVPTVTITLSPTTIPDGQVGTAYSQSVTATGGTAPYGYAVTVGSLPAGLSLNSSSGALTGTPTTAGAFSFTITATDAGSHTGSQAYTGNITAAPTVTITLAPSTLPGGQVSTAYSQTVTATGGTAPYGYVVTVGSLPAGLSLNATTGALTGTPTAAGTSNFTITATDAGSHTGQRAYALAISAMPVAPHHDATVSSGGSSTVNLTEGATGGPFTSAQIVSNSNPSAGSARIESSGGSFSLIFEADPTFNGNVTITYTLSNASQTSMPATVTFAVVNRPDPSTDAEVRGMLTAQASATRRFASSQINNFQSRLERLHDEGDRRRNSFGVGFSSGDSGGNRPLSTEEWEKQRLRPNNRRGMALLDPGTTASIDRKSAQRTCCESADSPFGNFAFWTGGFVNFGSRDRMTPQIDHTTVGVSGGVDYRFSDTFIAGVGAGFGNDTSDIGDNGTQSKGEAYSMALYSSWRPTPQTFVDGVLGYSFMNFDSRRFITANSTFANGTRDGDQIFGSLSAGYEYRKNGALLSPYTRLDLAWSRLDAFSESTGGIFALTYGKQNVDMAALAFGVRAEYDVQMSWGLLTPSLRAEYTHDFEGSSLAALGYADTAGTPNLSINVDPTAQDYVTLGVGLDAELNNNWMLGLQYRTAFGQGDERAHAVQVRVGTKF